MIVDDAGVCFPKMRGQVFSTTEAKFHGQESDVLNDVDILVAIVEFYSIKYF